MDSKQFNRPVSLPIGKCVQQDDMDHIIPAIVEADLLLWKQTAPHQTNLSFPRSKLPNIDIMSILIGFAPRNHTQSIHTQASICANVANRQLYDIVALLFTRPLYHSRFFCLLGF